MAMPPVEIDHQVNEGDVITFENLDKIRPYLPKDFWSNRDFFFYEGMKLEIGPTNFDYSPNEQTVDAPTLDDRPKSAKPEDTDSGSDA